MKRIDILLPSHRMNQMIETMFGDRTDMEKKDLP
jgi:hypothetical protein